MKKVYLGLDAEIIPLDEAELSTSSTTSSGFPCSPVWVANDIIIWHGFTVCAQMVDGDDDWTGFYSNIPEDDDE